MPDFDQLRREVQTLKNQRDLAQGKLDAKERELTVAYNNCRHDWGEPKYTPIYEKGYYIPGDREQGIEMGVDSRPGCHVPDKTIDKWTRTCKLCGKTETTTQTQQKVTNVPRW